ncbi:heat shock 70 kDa protein 12A-like [Mytilus galloprovincialis]|uniref:heat shock 70 kDa protein 12A-like n=1 Tax=Mytilus galloprovincialis TaxID=29158 RepID=UPI003F7B7B1F
MGNCLQGSRRTPNYNQSGHPTNPQGIEPNQLYPVLQQDGHSIMASAPPPYSERDPNIPQISNGRQSVRHVQRNRPSMFAQEQNPTENNKILVAAIDFGTTFSGYAFSFRHDYEADKLKISTNLWPHNSGLSTKAPSAVLIGPDRQVVAFGYDAQKKYADILETDNGAEYMFFQKFKMILYTTENLNSQALIYDVTGKEMLAIDVFGLVIGYLRDHLLQRLRGRDNKTFFQENMIQWVVTVPAIWNDKAKQFMRRAADQGGIKNENLTLALEPEAAALYCRYIPQCISASGSTMSTTALEKGTKYLILDLGGGTVDVTVHEIQEDGALQEVHYASGGCWGGSTVDMEFRNLLINIFGSDVIEEANSKYPHEILDLFLDFEMKKRTFEPGQTTSVALKCPACLYDIFKDKNNITVQEHSTQSEMKDAVEFKRDKIFVFASTFKSLFDNSVAAIVHHLNELLHTSPVTGVTTILLVGGYSDSYVIKDAIVSNFPHMRIINPDDCSLAVLKGAVLFGHEPNAITSRICKYTYGIVMNKVFVDGVHPESKRRRYNEMDICDDIFDIHLQKGEKIEIGKPRPEKAYYAPYIGADSALLEVYASTCESPAFVTEDSCTYLGSLVIQLSPDANDKMKEQLINVSFHYCGTELEVAAREEKTRNVMKAKFDFIG